MTPSPKVSKRAGCTCESCQECCRREPGWFLPDEIALAARYLRLDEPAFIATYLDEHLEDGGRALSPKRSVTTRACVFLTASGECRIHPVKPYECRKVYGCGKAARHQNIRKMILERWKK